MEQNNNAPKTCSCGHHKVVPVLIIIVGLAFLLSYMGILSWGATDIIWPIAVIIVGLMKLMKGKCKCCQK